MNYRDSRHEAEGMKMEKKQHLRLILLIGATLLLCAFLLPRQENRDVEFQYSGLLDQVFLDRTGKATHLQLQPKDLEGCSVMMVTLTPDARIIGTGGKVKAALLKSDDLIYVHALQADFSCSPAAVTADVILVAAR